jgi:hypothetical protein
MYWWPSLSPYIYVENWRWPKVVSLAILLKIDQLFLSWIAGSTLEFLQHILYLQSGWPDWANFRAMGDCLLWQVFLKKIAEVTHIVWILFSQLRLINFWQKIIGLHFGRSFSQTHLVTLFTIYLIHCAANIRCVASIHCVASIRCATSSGIKLPKSRLICWKFRCYNPQTPPQTPDFRGWVLGNFF